MTKRCKLWFGFDFELKGPILTIWNPSKSADWGSIGELIIGVEEELVGVVEWAKKEKVLNFLAYWVLSENLQIHS